MNHLHLWCSESEASKDNLASFPSFLPFVQHLNLKSKPHFHFLESISNEISVSVSLWSRMVVHLKEQEQPRKAARALAAAPIVNQIFR